MAGPLLRSLWSTSRRSVSSTSSSYLKLHSYARAAGFGRAFSTATAPAPAAAPGGAVDPGLLRNVAVIAHVDHGKTTLMDRLLRQCGADIPHERALDSISLERERGITIASKVTSLSWKENELNMVDTPGHADFGGEVERVVGMVEGAILVVDAGEGPLAQTKFVLAKALKYGLRPILLLNKVDKPAVSEERCSEVESLVFDLFANLGASEEQLDFPVLYASAKEGWASSAYTKSPPTNAKDMSELLDAIIRHVPPPSASLDAPFQMLVSMMEKDPYVGRTLTGRVSSGVVRVGDKVHGLRHTDSGVVKIEEGKVTKLMKKKGMSAVSVDCAGAGDIISMAGLTTPAIGHTVANVEVQYRHPPVERLSFHLPDCQSVVFQDDDRIENVLSRPTVYQSMFTAWFDANKKFQSARELAYIDMPSKFVWKKDIREWHPRKRGFSIGRIFYVPPGSGEIYYLRCLLNVVRGPTNFDEIKSYQGVVYPSFMDACYARGLLDDDREYIDAINEASLWSTATAMRKLFVVMLTSNLVARPENVWSQVWHHLADDVLLNRRRLFSNDNLSLSDDEKKNLALIEIERLLQKYNKSLKDFPHMPIPIIEESLNHNNRLLCDELGYDRDALLIESQKLESQLTDEQSLVYNTILNDVQEQNGGFFFVYGYGGTGKTFVWKALSAKIRSEGKVVLNVASSGIASLLLPGGRTAHSRFAIPIAVTEDSTCNISPGSHLAQLLITAKLIIWDEAPMMHKHCFECLDRTLRDIMRVQDCNSGSKTFGGKTVVLGGDFRQILPVVPKGSRQDIVSATINSSYLWPSCQVLRLTKNLRLNTDQPGANIQDIKEFSEWLAEIGDGKLGGPNDGYAKVKIPQEMLLPSTGDNIATIVDTIFSMFKEGGCHQEYIESRAILAPTLDVVNSVNEYMTDLHVAESRTYLSCDTVCKADSNHGILSDMHTPEFLNGLKASGIPNHALTLKVGSPVMLLRNIDHAMGLCNGTRLIITRLSEHVVEAKIVAGHNAGQIVLIPRMSMTPTNTRLPFNFQRRQFPLVLAYAMIINKSQGQTLKHVGLLLKKPVFVHGQLYVAASRVSHPKGFRILISNDDAECNNCTTNVVYHEVFNNL